MYVVPSITPLYPQGNIAYVYNISMNMLEDILKEWQPEVSRSNRASILKEIIETYRTEQETKLRKYKNIERYKLWLRERRIRHSYETAMKFQKNKRFIKELSDTSICVLLGHIKEERDLYITLSTCKDLSARGKSVASYIYGLAYPKKI